MSLLRLGYKGLGFLLCSHSLPGYSHALVVIKQAREADIAKNGKRTLSHHQKDHEAFSPIVFKELNHPAIVLVSLEADKPSDKTASLTNTLIVIVRELESEDQVRQALIPALHSP